MAVFKIEKCKCGYKHNEPKPGKTNKPCPRCGETMRYLDNFYISYQIHGKKYVESAETENRRNAELALAKRKVEIKEEKFFEKKQKTSWKIAAEALKKTYSNLDLDTRKMYDLSLSKLTPHFSRLNLEDISTLDLNSYKDKRLSEGVSGATFNRDRSTIKRMFALTGIPWNYPKTVFTREKEKKRELDLEPEEIAQLEANIKLPHLALAYLIATDTGMRRTAVLSLDINTDINFKDCSIKKIGKGGKETWVPITSRVFHALNSYIKEHGITHWLFPSPKDPTRPMQDLKRSFKTAQTNAKLSKKITWHHLRHLFSRDFSEKVAYDPKAKQDLMGHNDINMTMGTYTKTRKEHLRMRMEEFEANTKRNIGQIIQPEETATPDIPEEIMQKLIKAGWTPPIMAQTVH